MNLITKITAYSYVKKLSCIFEFYCLFITYYCLLILIRKQTQEAQCQKTTIAHKMPISRLKSPCKNTNKFFNYHLMLYKTLILLY